MVTIFTTPSCASCRKAKKWFEEYKIKYEEVNIFNTKLTKADIIHILDKTENGFDDIISTRSKIISQNNIDINNMKMNELLDFIIQNPSILRRPIIIDDKRLQIGYNDEEIRTFLPRHIREQLMCDGEICRKQNRTCDYIEALKEALKITV
ncbi:transcriptional regulator Spx [Mycoplasmatota bacterium]|nr:transcriptional regulator Spx [Mycoplasmatota bacterium]